VIYWQSDWVSSCIIPVPVLRSVLFHDGLRLAFLERLNPVYVRGL
jgi:hypothetical protein